MKRFGRHAIACLTLAVVAVATLGTASCSGNDAGNGGDGNSAGDGTVKATLDITASLDGHDVTDDSAGMIADADGNFAGELESGSDDLEASLAPGKYRILVTYQGDYDGVTPPMQVLDVELQAGRTTTKQVSLDKNVPASAMQFLQRLTMKAATQQAAHNGMPGGATGMGGARHADTSRLGTFAVCAGLPEDYFGDADQIPSDQLNAEPRLQFPTPKPVAMPTPPHATPMQLAFDTMWSKGIEAASLADAAETTMQELRLAIVWGDVDGAGKLVAHASELLPRMAAAGEASRVAEAKLLRLEIAPLLQDHPPPILDIDDPIGMEQAFVAWQQKLEQDGLPPQTVAKLESAGWSDKEIAAMTAGAIRAPAGQVVPQAIVGTVMSVAAIRRDEQGNAKQAAAANAELDLLRKGVSRCGPSL
jgi:hypothetical protein